MFDIKSTSDMILNSLPRHRTLLIRDGVEIKVWTHPEKELIIIVKVYPNKIDSNSFENLLLAFKRDPNYRAIKTVRHMLEKELQRINDTLKGNLKANDVVGNIVVPAIAGAYYLYNYQEITSYLQSFEYLKNIYGFVLMGPSIFITSTLYKTASLPFEVLISVRAGIKANNLNNSDPNVQKHTKRELNLQIANYFQGDLIDQPHPSVIFLHMNETPEALESALEDYNLTNFEKIAEMNL